MKNTNSNIQDIIERAILENQGILRLKPAWVARAFIPPGRRLGLSEDQYNLGERGGICERWLGSVTLADNKISIPDEGLSFLNIESREEVTLKDAIEIAGDLVMGADYNRTHDGLGRLPKIFNYTHRLPYHVHQMQEHAQLVGCNSKEEGYYFLEDVDLGKHPETFFGVHPYIHQQKKYDLLLTHLIEWKDDSILQYARAYQQMPGEGFHVPAGTLHAPGTALTIELQEDSDVLAMLQAQVGETRIDKELLFKDMTSEDRQEFGERRILDMINWEVNGDPYFYENRYTPPVLIEETKQPGGEEYWIFYNTLKFSGKKIVVSPGGKFVKKDRGVYTIFVWRGKGLYGVVPIEGNNPGKDELIVCHTRALQPLEIENTGDLDLLIYQFFGPDINADVPMLPKYPPSPI